MCNIKRNMFVLKTVLGVDNIIVSVVHAGFIIIIFFFVRGYVRDNVSLFLSLVVTIWTHF